MTEEKKSGIQVLIPVYRPDKKLSRIIKRLGKQTMRPDKIVLMVTIPDGVSEEETAAHLLPMISGNEILTECHFLPREAFDHGGTRNKGMEYCDSEIVICMTQDAVPENNRLVERLTAPFAKPFCGAADGVYEEKEIIVSYGRQMPEKNCRPAERYTRNFNYPAESRMKTAADLDTLGIKTFFASNVCAAYKRELFFRQGMFPERTIFNEDMIFAGRAIKAGYAIAYAAEARVIHSHNLSNKAQFQRNFDLAVSQAEAPDVFEGIRSEGEGIRLVKNTINDLKKSGKSHLIPGLILTTACKYTGYLLGKHYRMLPAGLVKICSMNKGYWRNK